MSDRKPLAPSPAHPITIDRESRRVVVSIGDAVLADTGAALTLREAHYPAVLYVPRGDVDMSLLARSEHASYCPYKGEATYFHIPSLGTRSENAVWTYEAPYDAVAAIRDHFAFYSDRVTIRVEDDATVPD